MAYWRSCSSECSHWVSTIWARSRLPCSAYTSVNGWPDLHTTRGGFAFFGPVYRSIATDLLPSLRDATSRLQRRGMVRFSRPTFALSHSRIHEECCWNYCHGVCLTATIGCAHKEVKIVKPAEYRAYSPHQADRLMNFPPISTRTWRLICEIAWPRHMLWRYHSRWATLPIPNYQIYDATSQQDQEWRVFVRFANSSKRENCPPVNRMLPATSRFSWLVAVNVKHCHSHQSIQTLQSPSFLASPSLCIKFDFHTVDIFWKGCQNSSRTQEPSSLRW